MKSEDAIVLLCDMQPEVVAQGCRTTPSYRLRLAASVLTRGCAALGIPMLSSLVWLGRGSAPQPIAELGGAQALTRSTVGVFDDEASRLTLSGSGRPVVAVGGVSSEVAVLYAVLGGLEAGWSVHVLTDLCGGLDERSERSAFTRMSAAGAVMSSVPSFLAGTLSSLAEPRAEAVIGSLSQFWS